VGVDVGVESERVGDGSGAPIAVELELGPDSLLSGEEEASENPFARVFLHASYVHRTKTSVSTAFTHGRMMHCKLTCALKACVDSIYTSNEFPKKKEQERVLEWGLREWWVTVRVCACRPEGTECE
jgi:hypothetical protein